MPNYRAYLMDDDGHVMSALNLSCLDEDAAADTAKQLADDHDVELWQFDRLVAVFKSSNLVVAVPKTITVRFTEDLTAPSEA